MNFQTRYNRAIKVYERVDNTRLIETQGYISAQKRIENLINAGQRLLIAREEMYDFPDGEIDEEAWDPTRSKNYDLADGTQQMLAVEQRLKAAKIRQKELKIELQKAQEGSEDVLKQEKPPE
jgi:hypothetical protein